MTVDVIEELKMTNEGDYVGCNDTVVALIEIVFNDFFSCVKNMLQNIQSGTVCKFFTVATRVRITCRILSIQLVILF